jgi:ubiquinone/menaquinone biosynthesis C-methylase UbiE
MEEIKTTVVPTRNGYDRWSEVYDDDGNPLVLLEEPHVSRLLNDVRGLSVLDVGCGTGRHAVRLAMRGARVTGVDFSAGMLQKARQKPGAEGVTFVEHDIAQPLPFGSASFDRVLSCLVLDHVANLAAFFSELRRVCRGTGFVVASVMHPAMVLKGVQARFQDAESGVEVRPASSSHQISDYVMGALQAGLRLIEMSEYSVDAALVSQTQRAEKHLGWPLLLLMKLAPEPPAS